MKKLTFLLILLTLFSNAIFADKKAVGVSCVDVNESDISKLFDRWNDSLKTGDASLVADNYIKDAVLLPTVSNKVRLTNDERRDYFEHFLEKKPVGEIENRVIRLGCNKAIDTGTYSFTYVSGEKIYARYTFTYVWNGDEWKISTHHSSSMPEKDNSSH